MAAHRSGPARTPAEPEVWVAVPARLVGPVRDLLVDGIWRLQQRNGGTVHPDLDALVRQLFHADPSTRPVAQTQPAPAPPAMLTVQEIALVMGASRQYVRRLAKEGRLPARKVAGVWLIAVEEERAPCPEPTSPSPPGPPTAA